MKYDDGISNESGNTYTYRSKKWDVYYKAGLYSSC